MPSYTACVSCGKRCRRRPDTAPGGPECFACRRWVCMNCGQPFRRRHDSAFCSDVCADEYRLAGVAA